MQNIEITSVKIQGEGYLLNGEMSVPKADGNREYEAIKEWLKDNTPQPEFTDAEIAQQEQDKINTEALEYLAATDWYVTRFSETGVEIPQVIKDAREEARAKIIKG